MNNKPKSKTAILQGIFMIVLGILCIVELSHELKELKEKTTLQTPVKNSE